MLINSYVFLFFFLYNICNDAKAKKRKSVITISNSTSAASGGSTGAGFYLTGNCILT